MKPALRSALAEQDIQDALEYYLSEAPHVVDAFIDALEAASQHIETLPGSGSPRYAHALDIPRLRFWSLTRFPYAIFYIEHGDHLDVLRLVHLNRDIPASLQGD